MIIQSDEFDEVIMDEPKQPKTRKKIIIIAVVVLVLLFAVGYNVYGMMLGYPAHSRYESLCADAQSVYMAAEMWVEDGNTLTTHRARMDKEEDAFSVYLHQYCGKESGWYVLVCDAEGNPDYALYSRKKISDKRMNRPDRDEEMKRLRSPLWHTYAIGCYPEET